MKKTMKKAAPWIVGALIGGAITIAAAKFGPAKLKAWIVA